MRKAVVVFLGMLAVLAGTVQSAPAEIDMDLMQTIEDLNKSLASNIALRDGKGSASDAGELDKLFVQVEAHYAARPEAADGLELSKKSRSLTAQILQLVAKNDFDAATNAATDLSRTCKTCHNFYKKD